jgi:predicted HNH restriction endonuclease
MEITFKFKINESFLNYSSHPITIPKSQIDYSILNKEQQKFDKVKINLLTEEKTNGYIYFGTAGYGDYYQIRFRDFKDDYLKYFELNKSFSIRLTIDQNSCSVFIIDPNQKLETKEDEPGHAIFEGAVNKIEVNRYERSTTARNKCLEYHGYNCSVCGFNFEQVFGRIGKNFIEVHHIIPISEIGENYKVEPTKDLIPICPNCHAMLHRKYPPYSVEELKLKLKK